MIHTTLEGPRVPTKFQLPEGIEELLFYCKAYYPTRTVCGLKLHVYNIIELVDKIIEPYFKDRITFLCIHTRDLVVEFID